ncbi:MAG: phenylalanine--tRNA ligase alpha subunit [Melioribacteraceae bacterium]|nr:MAG: phenylalanine--tRNA ligase alpha subunit [Melioribacteraceae bacterium]
MLEKIESAVKDFNAEINNVNSTETLEDIRVKFLGRKGLFAQLFEEFKALPKEEKPKYGQLLNKEKNNASAKFDEVKDEIESKSVSYDSYVDLTLPGVKRKIGNKHILIQTLDEIKVFFKGLGFAIYDGPELESDYNNFEALNFPEDHPARDMQDTFFVNDNFLLRTHTSPTQIRLMKTTKPPIRAIMPGKVYRNEAISAKSYCLFHQVEGLYIDTDVSFAELKSTLVSFAQYLFGADVKYRFRPSFFPFTEPSAEVDIWWEPKGKPGRWLEILGCGMVDPNVLDNVGIDSEKYVGYAFGMGVERMALRKYNIPDIRLFFDNDNRFLEQF